MREKGSWLTPSPALAPPSGFKGSGVLDDLHETFKTGWAVGKYHANVPYTLYAILPSDPADRKVLLRVIMVRLFGTPSRKYASAVVLDPAYDYPLPLQVQHYDHYATSSRTHSERSYGTQDTPRQLKARSSLEPIASGSVSGGQSRTQDTPRQQRTPSNLDPIVSASSIDEASQAEVLPPRQEDHPALPPPAPTNELTAPPQTEVAPRQRQARSQSHRETRASVSDVGGPIRTQDAPRQRHLRAPSNLEQRVSASDVGGPSRAPETHRQPKAATSNLEPRAAVSDVGGPSRSSTIKKKKKKVVIAEPQPAMQGSYNPMRMTGGYIRGVTPVALERKMSTADTRKLLQERMKSFTAMDLVPPPPQYRKAPIKASRPTPPSTRSSPSVTNNSVFATESSSSSVVDPRISLAQPSTRASSVYSVGYQSLRFDVNGNLTPPLSERGRRGMTVNSSYDAYSPWTMDQPATWTVDPPSQTSSSASSQMPSALEYNVPQIIAPRMVDSLPSSKSSSESEQNVERPRRPPRLHPIESSLVRDKSPLREETLMGRSISEAVSELVPATDEESTVAAVIGAQEQTVLLNSPVNLKSLPTHMDEPNEKATEHSLSTLPLLSPPSLTLQPPTPHHESEHTPFHNEDSPTFQNAGQTVPMLSGQPSMTAQQSRDGRRPMANGHNRTTSRLSSGEPEISDQSDSTNSSMPPTPERSYAHHRPTPAVGPSQTSRRYSSQLVEQPEFRPASPVVPAPRSRSRTSSYNGQSSSASMSLSPRPVNEVWGGPVTPPVSVPFLPANPLQPSYLRWDPATQRWQPVVGQPPVEQISKARSVASSVSAYSQTSATPAAVPRPPDVHSMRRASAILPPLLTTGLMQQSYRAQSPSPSQGYSRPSSPANLRNSPTIQQGPGFSNRRMSIDPPFSLSPTMLTFLPEMTENPDQVQRPQQVPSRPPSRSHSRQSSYHDGPYGATHEMAMTQAQQRNRNSMTFPAGYDPQARALAMAYGPARPMSDTGDSVSQAQESDWQPASVGQRSRPNSLYGGSQFGAASQFGGGSINGRMSERQFKPGKEPSLKDISTRADPVPLFGADGVGQESKGGYTTLVLPSGSYNPTSDPTKGTSKIDPRVLGMPSSTMSTVTISGSGARPRRASSLSFRRPETPTPAHLLADQPMPVAFSSHQAPPSKIGSSDVLVQIYAVALDKWDAELVKEKSRVGSGVGKWVPGRAFCGRALDVGADVRMIIKGDLVMGMVDIKKSGTLAEYMTCDRRRIARIPQDTHLSLEQLSCLPLLGIPAHRACCNLPRGSRALVFNAHEGIGALVSQELSVAGVHVIAQCPIGVDDAEDDCWDNGAKEVRVMGFKECLNYEYESSFDLVLDTVGGKVVYEYARRILRNNGLFVTLYGDTAAQAPAPKGPQLKQSFHSLRRAFVKKDKKQISYIHISPSGGGPGGDVDHSGQDSRDILEMAVMGIYRPKVGTVVPFERAADGFEELERQEKNGESGTVVVRLSN